jgi:hypothetical protein
MESYFISEIPLMGNDVVRWQAQAIEKFVYAEPTEERLEVLRNISQHAHDLPVELLWFVGIRGLQDQDHRIRGEVCYALGRSGMPFFVPLKRYGPSHLSRSPARTQQILMGSRGRIPRESSIAWIEVPPV